MGRRNGRVLRQVFRRNVDKGINARKFFAYVCKYSDERTGGKDGKNADEPRTVMDGIAAIDDSEKPPDVFD